MSLGGLSGLAGIDTEALVDQLMELERQPIQKLEQRHVETQRRADVLRDVNTRLVNLKSKLEALMDEDLFGARKATSSNEDVVTATADPSAMPAAYTIEVTQLAQAQRIASERQDPVQDPDWTWGDVSDTDGTFNIGLEGKTTDITVSTDDTLEDIARKINDADAGVMASVVDETLVLESTQTGADNAIHLEDVSGGVLEELGVINGDGNAQNELQEAQNAEFTVNGISVTRASNTASDVVDGVTFTLSDETGGNSVVVTVAENHDAALGKIKEFVDQYNSIHNFIQSKVGKDQEFQGYSTLVSLETRLWSAVSNRVEGLAGGTYAYLAEIGITVDKTGTLQLDEEKYEDAIARDPQAVRQLFTATEGDDGFTGVIDRVSSFVDSYTRSGDGILTQQQDIIREQLDSIEDNIVDWEDRLELKRRTLEQQFLAMEMAVAQMNNEQMWLSQQIGQLGSFAGGGLAQMMG